MTLDEKLKLPPVRYLRQRLHYDPKTGVLTWKARTDGGPRVESWNAQHVGTVAGHDRGDHVNVGIDGVTYKAHRIIWKMQTGRDPGKYEVDHKDTVRNNNRWKNLRLCDRPQQMQNTPLRMDNTSGVKGVSWSRHRRKWITQINFKGVIHRLGSYDDLEVAKRVVEKERRRLHREFARTH